MNKQFSLHLFGNLLGLVVICLLLLVSLNEQIMFHDLPCPLCLLQRICFVAVGLTMLMNLNFGIKPSHYGLTILSSLLGLGLALRQIHLHLAPNDPGYGLKFFGEYFYIWSALSFFIIIILATFALLFDKGFISPYKCHIKGIKVLTALFLLLILIHGISTLILCGPFTCPADPVEYYF